MITFYPTISRGELGKYSTIPRALLPASSWARDEVKKYGVIRKKIAVPKIPDCMTETAADCGGFVATRKWGGEYRYTPEQYVQWLYDWTRPPQWAAMMDYCCEDEITSGNPGVVRDRQEKTTGMAYRLWDDHRDAPWAWVPTIQGWDIKDYLRHTRALKPLIGEMTAYYGAERHFRVGIGTLCARASASMIRDVVQAVTSELPGVPIHLWGVKLSVFKSPIPLPEQVASVDSAAWNGMFGTGRNHWKATPYTQREWCFKVALPAYEQKVKAALLQPKQMSLAMEDAAS